MILLISDLHCLFHLVNLQIEHAERTTGQAITSVLVLGDFGLFDHALRGFFQERKERFARPVFFIEGNHEEFDEFDRLVREYAPFVTHLPRGSVREIDGVRLLALGGAGYMDAMTTPMAAEITDRDIDRCLAHPPDAVDLIISHDCPEDIGVPNSPGFEHYGAPGFRRSPELIRHFHPRFWVFGHHHKWFSHEQDRTRFVGLAESWNGYALLRDGRLEIVRHEIPRPQGPWERLWAWLLGS